MANTPEVDEWLQRTNQLTVAAISLAAQRADEDVSSMMRQVRAAASTLITALSHLQMR